MNRKKGLLILLVGLLALCLVYAYQATPRQEKVPEAVGPRPASSRPAAAGRPAAPAAEARLQLELLARQPEDFPGFKRNIFRFRQPAPPPPAAPAVSRVAPPPPPPPPLTAEPAPDTAALRRELARFTFLGFLQMDGRKTVFLSAGDEIFTVKQGDRFGKDQSFLVTDLSASMLTIRQADDPRPITVSLVEQTPLVTTPARPPLREVPAPGAPLLRRGPPARQRTGDVRPPPEPAALSPEEAVPPVHPLPEESAPPQDVVPSEVPNE